jgi:hypothetical protein
MRRSSRFTLAVGAGLTAVGHLTAQGLAPPPVRSSEVFLRVTAAGSMPPSSASFPRTNATSPLSIGQDLLLIEQRGELYRRDPSGALHTLLTRSTAPAGLVFGQDPLLNVAANPAGDRVFVVFLSFALPAGVRAAPSPRSNHDSFLIVYEYDYDGVALTRPRVLAAFEAYSGGHVGGGLAVLDDGSVLLAPGDNADARQDGGSHPQDSSSHVGKIVHITAPDTWTMSRRACATCSASSASTTPCRRGSCSPTSAGWSPRRSTRCG